MSQIKLVDVINKAQDLLSACQQLTALGTITAANVDSARDLASRISAASKFLNENPFDTLRKSADNLNKEKALDKANALRTDILNQLNLDSAPVQTSNRLEELFTNVSSSLIDAQKALNKSSLQYAAELDPRLPPTLYGIPNVKAEMRVGFSKVEGRGINLFLFTSSSQKQEFAESTVSFEVVGTPPPPGPGVFGDFITTIPSFLVVGRERDELVSALTVLPQGKPKITDKECVDHPEFAAVLRYTPLKSENPVPDWRYYIVLWPGLRPNPDDPKEENWLKWNILNLAADPTGKLHFTDDDPASRIASIFENPQPDNGVLNIPVSTLASLQNQGVQTLARYVLQLGDALMRSNLLVRQWLKSVEFKPNQ